MSNFKIIVMRKYLKTIIPEKIRTLVRVALFNIKFFPRTFHVVLNYLKHNNDTFENELSVAIIIKNEAPYIKEWIDYHRLIGVEKFYIYDNDSTDNVLEVLKSYIDLGIVAYHFLPGKKMQYKAYQLAVEKYKNQTKWLAIIDADEFIVPVKENKIIDVITNVENKVKRNIVSLKIPWVMYGYSGHREKQEGLIMENYTKNDGAIATLKSIVNPRTVIGFASPHYAIHFFGRSGVSENGEKIVGPIFFKNKKISVQEIRINHYYTKSYEEFVYKARKGRADHNTDLIIPDFDPMYSSRYDDAIMDKYIPIIKENIKERYKQ